MHGCMVYTERAEMAAVSCGTSYASAVSTPLRWIFKKARYKKLVTRRITCERSESARERRTALCKSDQQLYRPVPHRLYGVCGREATLEEEGVTLGSCVKVEVAILGYPSLIVRTVSVDVKQH